MRETTEGLSDYVRKVREHLGISMRELGKRCDVSTTHVSDIEGGKRRPSEELLKRIEAL